MAYDWPAIVNNFEAEAFCNWKTSTLRNGKRVQLISHPEWLLLAKRAEEVACLPDTPVTAGYNSNFTHHFSPCAVDVFAAPVGKHNAMVFDVQGNAWQHSRSLLTVMPTFMPHPVYDDFTLPTIDGHHKFILGGSFISLGNMATVDARYGFRSHFYQHAGIRYVCSDNIDSNVPTSVVEGTTVHCCNHILQL
jgi:hypothetical protein